MNQTKVITNFLESVFNSGSFINESPVLPNGKRVSSTPLDKGIVSPFDTGPTAPPPPLAPPVSNGSASTPINNGPTVTPSYKRPTVTPSYKGPTVTPSYKRPSVTPSYKRPTVTPSYKRPSVTPSYKRPTVTPSYKRPTVTPSYKRPSVTPSYKRPTVTPSYKRPSVTPSYKRPTVTPSYKRPTVTPSYKRPSVTPSYKRPTVTPSYKRPSVTPSYKRPTVTPSYKRPSVTPSYKRPTVTPSYKRPTVTPSPVRPVDKKTAGRHGGFWIPTQETTTYEPIYRLHWPTTRQRWDLKPPDIKIQPPIHVTTATGSKQSTNLEYFLWVVLGGIAVLVLMAIFMKIGKPIRRSRRQPSSARPSPIVTNRNEEPYYRNLDMGSHVRLMDADSPAHADPPPPYSACVGAPEDPPPSFASCCVTYTNTKHTEPKVHVQRPNAVCEHESIAINDSEDVDGIRSELVFVHGRIVQRPKIDLSSSDNQIRITNSYNVKDQRSKSADLKGRIVDETDIVKVNIY